MGPARVLAVVAACAAAAPVRGATTLLEGGGAALSLGGYARAVAGVQALELERAPEAAAAPLADHGGLSTSVLRLEWKAALGGDLSLEVHQRVLLRLQSEALPLDGERMGLGASVVPRRTVDLRYVAYDEDRLLLEHDLDALALRGSLGDVDFVLGRQAITWGFDAIFPVADLWTNFSPFELDTTQKHGIDALRVVYSRRRSLELEVVVADRGEPRDLSGGLRVASYLAGADLYVAAAKQWREVIGFAGASATAGAFKLHAEAAQPYDLDRRKLKGVRAAAGVDWLLSSLTLTLAGHFNGTGVGSTSQYLAHRASPYVQRGESYLLARWYGAAAAIWKISELLQLSASAVCNVQDQSAVLSGALAYRMAQGAELSLGAYRGLGATPVLGLQPELRSEFGAAGGLYYLALSSFF